MVKQRHHNLFVIRTVILFLLKFRLCETINEMNNTLCEQVPVEMLRNALGQAFNSRYMSENRPQETSIHIREPGEELSFTVDAGFQKTLFDTPVWLGERKYSSRTTFRPLFDSPVLDGNKEQRMLHKTEKLSPETVKMGGREHPTQSARPMSLEEEMATQDDLIQYSTKTNRRKLNRRVRRDPWHEKDVKLKPWLCEATKRWQDLGSDYFPSFLLSVDCSNRKCWYDEYACTPKSFTVKVLRKVKDYCIPTTGIDVNLVRLNSVENYAKLSELWVWEERAVTFCCECGATYNR